MALKKCARYRSLWSRCDEWSAGIGYLHCFFGPLTLWARRTPLSDQTGHDSNPLPQAARPAPFLGCLALTASVALILAASWPVQVSAQTVPPANTAAQGLRRQQQRQKRAQSLLPQAPNQLHRGPSAPASLARLPHESPCFVISAIRFTGAHAKRLAWLSHDLKPVLGQCVGVKGLARIANVLDTRLIVGGYTTSRVSFPPQNLRHGVLTIHLDVGMVAAVHMVNRHGQPDTRWGTWRNAFPVSAGDVLNIRALEQGVEQMDRLPSQAVHIDLVPGPAPDTSVVLIQRHEAPLIDRLHGVLTVDNFGTRYLGRPELSTALSFDNPLGLNDILSFTGNTNLEDPGPTHRSQSGGVSYSIPWGYALLTLSAQSLRFAQVVQGTSAQFVSSGEAQTQEARLDVIVWRSASTKIGVFTALEARQARNYLDNIEIVVQRLHTVNLDTGLTLTTLLSGGGEFAGEVDYRNGLGCCGAQPDLPTAATGGLTVRPHITSASLSWMVPLTLAGAPWRYSLSLFGQITPDTLVAEDQFLIGDQGTVRGFDGNTVLEAENGYVVRNDLSRAVPLLPGWRTAAYIGLDFGRVWGPSAPNLGTTDLAGTAIGLKAQRGDFQGNLALATPLYHPRGFQSQHLNLYASVTMVF